MGPNASRMIGGTPPMKEGLQMEAKSDMLSASHQGKPHLKVYFHAARN